MIILLKKIICCPIAIILELLLVFCLPVPIIICGLLRMASPTAQLKKIFTNGVEASALFWVSANHFIFRYLLSTKIKIIGAEQVNPKKNYLILANHQSWLDILMLEEALYRRTGFSRYFIKKNLLHIPLAGWACHILYYPSMRRVAKDQLLKNPERKGQDIAITRRACQKLKGIYFKLNNFPEGTRFTKQKHAKQQSPYRSLLKPKTGGIAHALNVLQDHLDGILDLTIVFAQPPNVIRFFLGADYSITVVIKKLPITTDLIGDYEQDNTYRLHIQQFISSLWQEKDQLIATLGDYRDMNK